MVPHLRNLTPHEIHLMPDGPGGTVIVVPPSGIVARCVVERERIGFITLPQPNGEDLCVPIHRTRFGSVEGLPEPDDDCELIVSDLVAQAVPEREDLLMVDDAARDADGRIIGAKALARP
ncbi:MAG: hypothetical protein Q8R92_14850 [Deltaproteobacteria bacterium]|nr:hypothetical protein [Deltaproteobacteria bacterium]